MVRTVIEILDRNLQKITEVRNPYPIDKAGNILRYSKELSDFGQCLFRIDANDRMLTEYGDIIQPHRYHVRIRRGNVTVWQGAIIENSVRNKDYMEVTAAEYEFYFSKKLIHRTSPDANGTTNIYRTFSSGTMADAVTAIINETITDYGGNHVLANMTIGNIENPDYPPNLTDQNGNKITGAWSFTNALTLQFDFHTVLYVLKAFGMYSYADFEISNDLEFNFEKFLGNDRHYDISFKYGRQGNVFDYNLPRLGQRMYNILTGIATDTNGVVLHFDQSDEDSVQTYGKLEGIAAYSDVKQQNVLNARTQAELPFISTPDETNVTFILNERGYPLGQYDIGDIITADIVNDGVDFKDNRRVVGITVVLHNTGRELTYVQTNRPLPWQMATTNIAGGTP